jgi:hypothetical protein
MQTTEKPWFRRFGTSRFSSLKRNLVSLPPMMHSTKTRRLTRHYLAAVDKVLSALDRAKELRTALRRELAKQHDKKGERRGTPASN